MSTAKAIYPPNEIWIVVPSYNEAKVIAETLSPLLEQGYQVVVVDDCSTDDSQSVLAEIPGLNVLRHAINLGQGASLQSGIEFALEQKAQVIVTFDADGQHSHLDIPKLLEPLIEDEADVVLGSRFLTREPIENLSSTKKLVLKLAILYTNLWSNIKLTDAHNGLRAFSRFAALRIKLRQNRMAHASEIISKIREERLRFTEVPVKIIYTKYSIQKGQRIWNSFNILWDVFVGGFKL